MIEIDFDLQISDDAGGGGTLADTWLDPLEVELLLETTKTQTRDHIQRRLAGLRCEAHDQAPRLLVTGRYSSESEQLELSYHIEACCNLMTMRTAALLARS